MNLAGVYRYQFAQYFEAHSIDKSSRRYQTKQGNVNQPLCVSSIPSTVLLPLQCRLLMESIIKSILACTRYK